MRWLSPLHFNIKHEESVERIQHGSGLWLFDKGIYQRWEGSSPSSLWIHGIPGCGKTILAFANYSLSIYIPRLKSSRSIIIQRLEKKFPAGSSCGLAYFYCQYNREDTQRPPNIARCILAQLLQNLDYRSIENTMGEMIHKISSGQGPPQNLATIEDCIVNVSKLYSRAVIVIDGVDECPRPQRRQLLDFIVKLSSSGAISITALSRKEVDIEDELRRFATISLLDEGINFKEDMRKLIEDEFKDTRKWDCRFQDMKQEITEELILGSGINM